MGDKNQKWKELFGSEWDYIQKLGAAIHDPHAKKEFWENIRDRKQSDPTFSIYELFPKEKEIEQPKKFPGAAICADILETLSVHKKDESA